MSDPVIDLASRFTWRRMWLSGFRILRDPSPVEGDCKSFALTTAWLLAERSVLLMIWDMLTLRTVIWIVWANEGHVTTWRRGKGWICNIYRDWRPDQPSKKIIPAPLLILAFVIAIILSM